MKTLADMQKRRDEATTSIEEIKAKALEEARSESPDEKALMTNLLDEMDVLDGDIAIATRIERAAARKNAVALPQTVRNPPQSESHAAMPATSLSGLRAFKVRSGETHQQVAGRAYKAGQFLLAVCFGNDRARAWCHENGVETRAVSEGVATKGGVLVPSEFESAVIDLRETYGVFRKYAKVVPMTRDHLVVPRRTGGVTAYPVGEAAEVTVSDKSWDQVELTARKWGALVKYSSEVSEDAVISIADDLAQEIAYAFSNKEDDCGFNGTGASTYHGIRGVLTKMIDGNHTKSYYTTAYDTFAEIIAGDLAGVMGQLPGYAYARGTPRWYIPTAGKALVFDRLANALSGNSKIDAASGNLGTYAGFEIVQVPVWTGIGSTDFSAIIAILFGDLSMAATLGDRRGTRIKVSDDRYLENDQIAILGTTRFDINVHDLGDTSVAGPLVGLLGT